MRCTSKTSLFVKINQTDCRVYTLAKSDFNWVNILTRYNIVVSLALKRLVVLVEISAQLELHLV